MELEFSKLLSENDMKCNICKHYLSVSPINYTESTGVICGRCEKYAFEKNSKPVLHQQIFFENIARRMKFPCMYEDMGCDAKLRWEDVREHEKSCNFNIVTCVYGMEEFADSHQVVCDWKGPIDQLIKHSRESHHENFASSLKLPVKVEFKNNFLFTEYFGQVFLVISLYDNVEDVFTFLVQSDILRNEEEPLNYKVKFFNGQGVSFSSLGTSSPNIFGRSKLIERIGLKIYMSYVRLLFAPTYFCIEFISKKFPNSESSDVFKSDDSFELVSEDDVRRTPICACYEKCDVRYLVPPVYLCYKKHNVCGACLEKYNHCCNKKNIRNHALERLLYSSSWNCENSECSHVSSVRDYAFHQKICRFRTRKCLSENCEWNGNSLTSHMEISHEISELDQDICLKEGEEQFFFLFDQHIFVLKKSFTFDLNESSHLSSAIFQLICGETVEFLYKFEIEISSPESPHSKVAFQQLVEPEHLPIVCEYERKDIVLSNILHEFFPSVAKVSFSVNISRITSRITLIT